MAERKVILSIHVLEPLLRRTLSLTIRYQVPLTDAPGGEDGSRTHDLLNAIQALSQTELQPHIADGLYIHDYIKPLDF